MKITLIYDWIEDKYKEEYLAEGKKFPLVNEQIAAALEKRGHKIKIQAIKRTGNLLSQLNKDDGEIFFNLLDSMDGITGREQSIVGMLELIGKPFTGTGTRGLALAQDKAVSKKIFAFHGIPTPRFMTIYAGEVHWSDHLRFPLFVKPLDEDASIGITQLSIVNNVKELMDRISFIHTEFRTPVLVEEYIEGRELYIGVLGNEKPEALPLIEWDFSRVPDGIPRIASFEAKWDEESEHYRDTPEIFPEDIPPAIVAAIHQHAKDAFKALKLCDYARFDVRLRKKQRRSNGSGEWEYFFIEANPNPYLEKNAEFIKSARKHGLSYPDTLERIIELAIARQSGRRLGPLV